MPRSLKESLADLDQMAVEVERLDHWLSGWYFGKETFEANYQSALQRVLNDLGEHALLMTHLFGNDRKGLVDHLRLHLTGGPIVSRDIPQTTPVDGSTW